MNNTGKKIAAKVAAIVAVSGSVFALSATSATASPVSTVVHVKPQAPAEGCRPPSLAHCYTKDTMENYLETVLPDIREFFGAKYRSAPGPSHHYFIPERRTAKSACGELGEKTYSYCRLDKSVYLGQTEMWDLYDKVGDIAPAIGLAHEWGHYIQSLKGVTRPTNSDESVEYENQADCVAGSWLQYADQQNRLEQEDFHNIDKLVAFIADAEGTEPTHGTAEQRRNAVLLGMQDGLAACNSFYPATPIFTGRD